MAIRADRGAVMRTGDIAQRIGLRRVDWVRLKGDHDAVLKAEAVGMGFRLPVTRPIPLGLAAELIASGTPYVRRHVPA